MKNKTTEHIINEGMGKFPSYKPPKNENIGTFAGMCLAFGIDIDENKGDKDENWCNRRTV